MAIPGSGFSLSTVRSEFLPNSRPSTSGLSQFLNSAKLIGGGDRLTSFANKGVPSGSVLSATNITSSSAVLRGNISNTGGAECGYYWLYRFGTTGSWTVEGHTTGVTLTGTVSRGVSLSPGTYQVRFMYYNGFNAAGSPGGSVVDHFDGGQVTVVIPQPSQASIVMGTLTNVGFQQYQVAWTQGTPRATSIRLDFRINSGTWQENVPFTPTYNSSNSSHTATFFTSPLTPVSGDILTVRLTGFLSGFPQTQSFRDYFL